MEYEVTTKTTSADDALGVLTMLPQPVYIAIIKGGYNLIKEHAYQDIINKIGGIIPIAHKDTTHWTVERMLSSKGNIVFTVNDNEPGNSHRILSHLRRHVNKSQGSIMGIRVQSTLRSASQEEGYKVELHPSISDCLDCLIVAYCS